MAFSAVAGKSKEGAAKLILIGLGANLPTSEFGPPVAGCEAALVELDNRGLRVAARSRWYTSAPVPPSDQPWFVNGVARVETALTPDAVLAVLHAVERRFGRVRTVRNAARTLDLDLLAYGDVVLREGEVVVPHPRLHERAFVLLPLAEVAPGWRHPVLGLTAAAMVEALPPDQTIRPLR
jgi:2-amino-4-hydroxy-6-hydroxymethyldihydropteridine diphosphokinase